MAKHNADKLPAGARLDALVAERVFGWKNVHQQAEHEGDYWGKKRDKAGRWRSSRVPDYSTDARFVSQIEERMKELKLFNHYERELSKIARTMRLPADWAPPDQRCRAALKALRSRGALRVVKR